MMSNLIQLFTFMFAIGTPLIALYAELSFDTPSTILHTIIRSSLCMFCLISASYFMSSAYQANLLHLFGFGAMFFVSIAKLYIEKIGFNLGKVLQQIVH